MAGRKINTYVFFDIEGTGLTGPGLVPRITEISLVAVSQVSLTASDSTSDGLPRVLDKLTVCVCPRKTVPAFISEMTGLYNDVLQHQTDFNANIANMINSFIEQHEQPICLVAHNGTQYDFGFLRAEYASVGIELPPGLLCVDSLIMFKEMDSADEVNYHNTRELNNGAKQQETPKKPGSQSAECPKAQAVKRKLFPDNASDGSRNENTVEIKKAMLSSGDCTNDHVDRLKTANVSIKEISTVITDQNIPNFCETLTKDDSLDDDILSNMDLPDMQMVTTQTVNKSESDSEKLAKPVRKSDEEGNGNEDKIITNKEPSTEKNRFSPPHVPKIMTFTSSVNQELGIPKARENEPRPPISGFTMPTPPPTPMKKVSYKLKELHKRVVGNYPLASHRAEDDSLAMVRIFHKAHTKVCSWAENNAVSFDTIPLAFKNRMRTPLPPGVFPYE